MKRQNGWSKEGSGDPRAAGQETRGTWAQAAVVAVLALLFLISQRLTLAYFWETWESPDHYYAHGLLVPILAAIMVRMNRGRLRQARPSPSWLGLAFALFALIIQVVGAATGFEELSGFAFLLMVYASILSLYGLRTARILFWPVLFLTAMIPLPQIMLDGATAKYQLVSSYLAAQALRLVDGSVIAHGNMIVGDRLPEALLVAPACSGLRLSVTLVMCAWFLLYVLEGNWRRKIALALLVLPIGAVVNAGRIAMIGWAAMRTGSAQTIDSFHDTGGYIGIAACSILLLCTAWLIGLRRFRDPDAVLESRVSGESRGSRGNTLSGWRSPNRHPKLSGDFRIPTIALKLILALIFILAALASGSITGVYSDLPKGRIERAGIPASVSGWQAQQAPIDAVTRSQLVKADLLNLVYRNPSHPRREIYVLVDSAVDISMFHDPRLCLVGGGSRILLQKIVKLKSSDPRVNGAPAWLLLTGGPDSSAWMLCVYRTPDGFLPTKDAINAYTLKARLNDLKRMSANPTSLESVRQDAHARQITWYRFVTYSGRSEQAPTLLQDFATEFVTRALENTPPQSP